MTLVKLNGQIHVYDNKNGLFVRFTKTNVVKALSNANALPQGWEFVTKSDLIQRCEFDDNGQLVS